MNALIHWDCVIPVLKKLPVSFGVSYIWIKNKAVLNDAEDNFATCTVGISLQQFSFISMVSAKQWPTVVKLIQWHQGYNVIQGTHDSSWSLLYAMIEPQRLVSPDITSFLSRHACELSVYGRHTFTESLMCLFMSMFMRKSWCKSNHDCLRCSCTSIFLWDVRDFTPPLLM